MGVYVLALRSPKTARRVRLNNGNVVVAASLSYLYKPFYQGMFGGENSFNRKMERVMDRLAALWEEKSVPAFAAYTSGKGHRIKIGDDVYTWPHRGECPMAVYDDPDMGRGEVIGQVAEVFQGPACR